MELQNKNLLSPGSHSTAVPVADIKYEFINFLIFLSSSIENFIKKNAENLASEKSMVFTSIRYIVI